jgi:hypothetical protein
MSLGFGQYHFGAAGFGYAPLVLADPRGPNSPTAWRYDGASSDWAIGPDDGRPRSTHMVDQGMAFSVLWQQGTIASDARIGNTLLKLPLHGGVRDQSMVEDCIRNSFPCKLYLADGRVEIISIEHELISTGGLKVVVHYRNVELKEDKRVFYES